jgi:hypothetical protein
MAMWLFSRFKYNSRVAYRTVFMLSKCEAYGADYFLGTGVNRGCSGKEEGFVVFVVKYRASDSHWRVMRKDIRRNWTRVVWFISWRTESHRHRWYFGLLEVNWVISCGFDGQQPIYVGCSSSRSGRSATGQREPWIADIASVFGYRTVFCPIIGGQSNFAVDFRRKLGCLPGNCVHARVGARRLCSVYWRILPRDRARLCMLSHVRKFSMSNNINNSVCTYCWWSLFKLDCPLYNSRIWNILRSLQFLGRKNFEWSIHEACSIH